VASLVWASLFLLFTIVGSVVGCVGMLGLPIAAELKAALIAVAFLLLVSGILVPGISVSSKPRSQAADPTEFQGVSRGNA
jgi:hypothetical protein